MKEHVQNKQLIQQIKQNIKEKIKVHLSSVLMRLTDEIELRLRSRNITKQEKNKINNIIRTLASRLNEIKETE